MFLCVLDIDLRHAKRLFVATRARADLQPFGACFRFQPSSLLFGGSGDLVSRVISLPYLPSPLILYDLWGLGFL